MACCGQQRAALTQNKPAIAQTHTAGSSVNVRFKQPSPVLVRGPITGRHYQFNGSVNTLSVDARDAAALIKTGYFQLV
ncbi:hypothetical protein H7849_02780 [Alloacidobacterium dinghuense]|uniref:Uncharacterized protein n=1 Tax=Alloacidobacterium dinghuense TaxID=2763107 RepID=A0A7G8BK62_9BACT|nr:hypothetical protein [Alloacidobacterium dinghuense]QNI32932.1 hypothetical protein H7849_02780 [Alloacidobacterium dinghuense]